MSNYALDQDQLLDLEQAHRDTYDRRMADRIKAVILLSKGWTASHVAEALLMDRNTVREYFRRFKKGGLDRLTSMAYQGSESYLSHQQIEHLADELDSHLYSTTAEINAFIKKTWGIEYSERGINSLLHRIGFVFKKTKAVPSKADAEAQENFLKEYHKLKQDKDSGSPIYFADATHPQHNTQMAPAGVRKGKERQILSNTGRQRLNINGAIDIQTMATVIRYEETVNADAAIGLFQDLEAKHPTAEVIDVICDNARYYRSKRVREYLKKSRVNVIFLPPYSPNLNLIERFWKFFKKEVLYNRYYEKFHQFENACNAFFDNLEKYRPQLKTLLVENFEIIHL